MLFHKEVKKRGEKYVRNMVMQEGSYKESSVLKEAEPSLARNYSMHYEKRSKKNWSDTDQQFTVRNISIKQTFLLCSTRLHKLSSYRGIL